MSRSPYDCEHFRLDYPNGERVLVCPCCGRFWELRNRQRSVGELVRSWVESTGPVIYTAVIITLMICTIISTAHYLGVM